jgi:hypothetical protein
MANLPKEEADLFFKLMWGLQFYVSEQRCILPKVKSVEKYVSATTEERVRVRDALWENPALIDSYCEANPAGFTAPELEIIRGWRRFVAGTFHIFRHLKPHTIFLGGQSQAYGVLGLYDRLDEMFDGRSLPIMVEAVLLPFRGRIVYDGVLKGYNIHFGAGIRGALNETYMAAKSRGQIITTLEGTPELTTPRGRRIIKGAEPTVEEIAKASARLRGGSEIQSAAFALLRASAGIAQSSVQNPDDLDELRRLERQTEKAMNRLQRALRHATT